MIEKKQHPNGAPGSDYLLSLKSIVGKNISDIHGYVGGDFGFPVFKCIKIVFEDGSEERLDGEHDIAYIPSPAHHVQLRTKALKVLDPEWGEDDHDDDDDDQ